jgi:hypothetical protein
MGGPVGYRTDDQNRSPALLSAVAQAEPPVLLSTPVRLGGAGAIRAASPGQHLGANEGSTMRTCVISETLASRAADQHKQDGPGSGNLIVITGTDRTDGTLSRSGQALVQDPAPILVTGRLMGVPALGLATVLRTRIEFGKITARLPGERALQRELRRGACDHPQGGPAAARRRPGAQGGRMSTYVVKG